jgi:hypothetical protein
MLETEGLSKAIEAGQLLKNQAIEAGQLLKNQFTATFLSKDADKIVERTTKALGEGAKIL